MVARCWRTLSLSCFCWLLVSLPVYLLISRRTLYCILQIIWQILKIYLTMVRKVSVVQEGLKEETFGIYLSICHLKGSFDPSKFILS